MNHCQEFVDLCEKARDQIKEIDIQSVNDILATHQDVVLIDVREDHEWAKGHVPQAQHLGRGIIERDIAKLCPNKDTKIILYCGGGYRSALAAVNLQTMGYTQVLSMATGYRGWQDAEFPTITS